MQPDFPQLRSIYAVGTMTDTVGPGTSASAAAIAGKADMTLCGAYVCLWPLADIAACTAHVRYWG